MPPPTGKLTSQAARSKALARDEYRSDDAVTPVGGTGYIGEFYDVDPFLAGLEAGGFTRFKQAQRLAHIFNDPDPKLALAASKEIRANVKEAAFMSGAVGRASVSSTTPTPEGEQVRVVHRTIIAPQPPALDAAADRESRGIIIRRPIRAQAGDDDLPEPEEPESGLHAPEPA